jgi:SAM-dependent methyltransferase
MASTSEQNALDRAGIAGAALAKVNAWVNGARILAVLRELRGRGWFEFLAQPRSYDELLSFSGLPATQLDDLLAVLVVHEIATRESGTVRLTPSFAEFTADDASAGLDEILAYSAVSIDQLRRAVSTPGPLPLSEPDALVLARASGGRPTEITKVLYEHCWIGDLPELSDAIRSGRFLDAGCGVATTALTLARIYPESRVVGIDVVPAVIAEAEVRAETLGVADRAEFRCVDAQEFEADNSFDAAFWAQPFFPESARAGTLAAIRRALRPGGLLVLQEMAVEPTNPAALPGYTLRRLTARSTGHLYGTTAEALIVEAEAAGFELVRIARSEGDRYVIMRRP